MHRRDHKSIRRIANKRVHYVWARTCTSVNAVKIRNLSGILMSSVWWNPLSLWDFAALASRFRAIYRHLRTMKNGAEWNLSWWWWRQRGGSLCMSLVGVHPSQQKVKINERKNIMIPFNHNAFIILSLLRLLFFSSASVAGRIANIFETW